MVEIVGDPATAKSAFGAAVIAAFQRAGGLALLLDTEAKMDRAFAETLGVNWTEMGYARPENVASAIRIIGQVAKTADPKTPALVVWDSIAATPGVEELNDAVSDDGLKGEKAARARYLSAGLRAVLGELLMKGVTLLAINQLRTTFSFVTGYSGVDSPGGRAVKYHSALRLMMRPKGRIRDRERDIVTGILVEIEAIKNTCSVPFRKTTLKFRFDSGFVRWSGLDELLLRHGRITSSEGWLDYKGRKFRASEIEQVAAEAPDLIAPLGGIVEGVVNGG